jgi:hypothetical protein
LDAEALVYRVLVLKELAKLTAAISGKVLCEALTVRRWHASVHGLVSDLILGTSHAAITSKVQILLLIFTVLMYALCRIVPVCVLIIWAFDADSILTNSISRRAFRLDAEFFVSVWDCVRRT